MHQLNGSIGRCHLTQKLSIHVKRSPTTSTTATISIFTNRFIFQRDSFSAFGTSPLEIDRISSAKPHQLELLKLN